MAQDRRREQYGFEEGSWGEEDRRQRYGRGSDWQRRNDEMRRRDWQGGQQSGYRQGGFGRGFEDYGRGRDEYGGGGDREVQAETGRGYGQGSYSGAQGRRPFGQGGYGQAGYGQESDYDPPGGGPYGRHDAGQYGYGYGGSSDYGSGQQYGYGGYGWRGSSGGDRDWQGGPYGGSQRGGGSGFAAGGWQRGNPYAGQHGNEQRGIWDRASDEVASWLGDDRAQQRRDMDQHRGKGPKNYARSDERIKEDVCDNLAEHPMVDASEIDVKVQAGEVTLDGTVGSRQEKRAAEDCVERISGIKHLQNNLRVQHGETAASSKVTMGHATYSSAGASGADSGGGNASRTGTAGAGSSGSIERK